MRKYILDLVVTENLRLHNHYVLLKLTSKEILPEMQPGQFAEIRVDNSPNTFLRRPISINYVDRQKNEVWLADVKDFSAFHEAVFKAKTEYGIINTALAVKVMAKLALERFAELEMEDGANS